MLYYELLSTNTTVMATLYTTQLRKLANVIRQKRPQREQVRLLHDNARPHVAKMTRKALTKLGWEELTHSAYSPDLAPSDYHLFRALKHHLREMSFDDRNQLENKFDQFFALQSRQFRAAGIEKLPERWGQVIDSDGDYIID